MNFFNGIFQRCSLLHGFFSCNVIYSKKQHFQLNSMKQNYASSAVSHIVHINLKSILIWVQINLKQIKVYDLLQICQMLSIKTTTQEQRMERG